MMVLSPAHEESLRLVLGRAPIGFLLFFVVALGTLAAYPLHLVVLLPSILFGAVAAGLIFLSFRYYHFWLSWLIWVVPTAAAAGVILALLPFEGPIDRWQVMWQGLYFGGAATFGTLWAFRRVFLQWLRQKRDT
jgi:hypothetical protein